MVNAFNVSWSCIMEYYFADIKSNLYPKSIVLNLETL